MLGRRSIAGQVLILQVVVVAATAAGSALVLMARHAASRSTADRVLALLALELRSRLEPALGISLPGNFVWQYATLAALADGLAERAALPLE